MADTILCYFGPDVLDKYPDDWCCQWREKSRVEAVEPGPDIICTKHPQPIKKEDVVF